MASEKQIDRQAPEQRTTPGSRIPVQPKPASRPPLLHDGLEVLRSSHC